MRLLIGLALLIFILKELYKLMVFLKRLSVKPPKVNWDVNSPNPRNTRR